MKPATRPIGAVVCDLDGTLIDTECVFAEAARRLLACRGKQLEVDFLGSIQGTPGRDALPRFRERFGLDEPIADLAAEYKRLFFETLSGQSPALMPGVVAFLDRLEAQRVPCAIATSSRREYVDTVFGPHGLLQRFAFILTADDVTHGKPHPEIYEKAVTRLSLPALEIAVIEDSSAGLQAALAAGTRCVVVPHSHTPRDQIVDAHAIVQSLHDPELWRFLGIDGA
jgi:HAD superfamily hydrolase (TIGR01509 family)